MNKNPDTRYRNGRPMFQFPDGAGKAGYAEKVANIFTQAQQGYDPTDG